MPLPLALPVGLIVGMTLAWIGRSELARSEVPVVLARPFLVAVALAAIVFGPVVGYFAALHGDWAYLYMVPWSRVPSAVDLSLVVLAAAQVPLGFAIASPWAVAKRGPRLLKVCAAVGAVVLVACAIGWRRVTVSGTYVQFHDHFGMVPIGRSSLGRGLLSSWMALAAAYAWAAHVLRSPEESR